MDYEKELRRYKIICEDSLKDYLNLIESEDIQNGYCENHHILPRCMFKEYETDDWNIKRLSFENHLKAHKLLFLIYGNTDMALAYQLMCRFSKDGIEHYSEMKMALSGDNNPAKRSSVREKIRKSKTGVKRPDMVGKRYMGASDETINSIIENTKRVHSGMVSIEDKEGNRFKVSINDPRFLSGELVSHNKGKKRPNNAMKNPVHKEKQISNRSARYELFKTYSLEQMVDYVVESFNNGKSVFNKQNTKLSSNYSYYCKLSDNQSDLVFKMVVQRLEKDNRNIESSIVAPSGAKQ